MHMDALESHGVERGVVGIWKKQLGEDLLPVQEKAVRRGVFLGRHLVVFAPTSSGKTFIGEMAAVNAARGGRRAVYLVPLRAIAEEKYREFSERYAEAGIRVAVSTRDRSEDDLTITRESPDLIVATYEKFAALLAAHPKMIESIGLVVVDELQLILDESRGPELELMLTRVRNAESPPQVVALSAVLGKADGLADWLGAECIVDESRPVVLRKGVIRSGTFRYVEHGSGREGRERLLPKGTGDGPDPHDTLAMETLLMTAEKLAGKKKEQVLVFLPTKHACLEAARRFAADSNLGADEKIRSQLGLLEESLARESLMESLQAGVAFHHADLPLAYRELIEDRFRQGGIRVLFSTSTLAMGVNLPVTNVLIWPRKRSWNQRYGWASTEITRMEYENMAGRAGRLGYGTRFGRAIVATTSPMHELVFFDKYVTAPFESCDSALADQPLAKHLLRILSHTRSSSREDVSRFLLGTFTGAEVWRKDLARFEERLTEGLEELRDCGLCAEERKGTILTDLGRAAAVSGVRPRTLASFVDWCREHPDQNPTDLELLLFLSETEDAERIYVPLSRRDRMSEKYVHLLSEQASSDLFPKPDLRKYVETDTVLSPGLTEGLKKALVLSEWIDERPLSEIEDRFGLGGGSVQRIAEEFAWLADALAAAADVVRWGGDRDRLRRLARRLQFGVHADILALSPLVRFSVSRSQVRLLTEAGMETLSQVRGQPREVLIDVLGSEQAARLLSLLSGHAAPKATIRPRGKRKRRPSRPAKDSPLLVLTGKGIEAGRTGIFVRGKLHFLPEREFEVALLFTLATRNGRDWIRDHLVDPEPETARKTINRVRRRIAGWLGIRPNQLMQNNRRRAYRLLLSTRDFRVDLPSLKKMFPEVVADVEKALGAAS